MIYIIDYQSGNLGAIQNMFKKIGAQALIASDPNQLEKATKIILPGVGTFDTGMQNLISGGWIPHLTNAALVEKKPIMGICLGMQLLSKGSEEGVIGGLGLVDAYTRRFSFTDKSFKIPHMGWNEVQVSKESKLISRQPDYEKRFYFAHGYYVKLENPFDELLRTSYGFDFSSALEKDNIIGLQFHPEKSHRFGMELLRNFVSKY
jgi:imidazole glycerol-phosphate synthase subunit HisH